MALHWIQENIIYFGGDPHNVTLIGYSSGAIIIHALMLSPITKGKCKLIIKVAYSELLNSYLSAQLFLAVVKLIILMRAK